MIDKFGKVGFDIKNLLKLVDHSEQNVSASAVWALKKIIPVIDRQGMDILEIAETLEAMLEKDADGKAANELLGLVYPLLLEKGNLSVMRITALKDRYGQKRGLNLWKMLGGAMASFIQSGAFSDADYEYLRTLHENDCALPNDIKIIEEYVGADNPRAYLQDLITTSENTIMEGFNPENPREMFLAYLGLGRRGVKISFDDFKKRVETLYTRGKELDEKAKAKKSRHKSYFKGLFAKAKKLKTIHVGSEEALVMDVKDVDVKILSSHYKELKKIQDRIASLKWLKKEFNKNKVFNVRNIYYHFKRRQAIKAGKVKESERFRTDFPSKAEMLSELSSDYSMMFEVLFEMAQKRVGDKKIGKACRILLRDVTICQALLDQDLAGDMKQDADPEKKVRAFQSLYGNYINHLPNTMGFKGVSSHRVLANEINEFARPAFEEIAKVDYIKSDVNGETYTLVPQGFPGVFRGRAFINDCSFNHNQYGTPYTRAMHEDTIYYFVYKGKELKGYVGLFVGKTEGGTKILTIDTIQAASLDGEDLLMNLFKALDKVAQDLGCKGIALLASNLKRTFDFENRNTIKGMRVYKNGINVTIGPYHEDAWGVFTEIFGKDEYHSIEYGDFRLLKLADLERDVKDDQIGKKARGEITVAGNLKVIDSRGDEHRQGVINVGEIDISKIKTKIRQMSEVPSGNREVILRIIRLLEHSPPELCVFEKLIDDFFGLASVKDDLIALHRSVYENPIALFHEIAHFLINKRVSTARAGLLKLKLVQESGKKYLIVRSRKDFATELKRIAKIEISDSTQKFIDDENWDAGWEEDQHYLLRVMQRELLGGYDKVLSDMIVEEQLGEAADVDDFDGKAVEEIGVHALDEELETSTTRHYDEIIDKYLELYKRSIRKSEARLLKLRARSGIAETFIVQEKRAKATYEQKLQQAEQKVEVLRSKMKDDTVASFLEAVKVVGGIGEFSDDQNAVLKALSQVEQLNFKSNEVLFVPRGSWVHDLFDFHALGHIASVSDSHESKVGIIMIDHEVEGFEAQLKIVLHEAIHKIFYDGEDRMMETNPEEQWIYRVFNEAVVEMTSVAMFEKIAYITDVRERIISQLGEEMRMIYQEDGYKRIVQLMTSEAHYKRECAICFEISKIWGEEGEEAINELLMDGNSERLRNIIGNGAWRVMLDIIDAAMALEAEEEMAYEMIKHALSHEDREARLKAALLIIEAAIELDSEGKIDMWVMGEFYEGIVENLESTAYQDIVEIARYKAGVALFAHVLKKKTLDLAEMRKVAKGIFFKLFKQIAKAEVEALQREEVEEEVSEEEVAANMYASVREIVPEVADIIMKAAPTYDLAPAMQRNISPTTSCARDVEQVLGRRGHQITAKHYAIDDGNGWFKNLKERLRPMLKSLNNDMLEGKTTTRMIVRTIGKWDDVSDFVYDTLYAMNTEEDGDVDVKFVESVINRVHIVHVNVSSASFLNPVIDLFTDIACMEVDRFRMNDYAGKAPMRLKEHLVSLLKASALNMTDVTVDNLKEILMDLFMGERSLLIRSVNWESMRDWKRANDSIVQSL